MYEALYQYFIQHKQLPMPGIGTFLLERKAVESDFVNKKMNPPVYAVALRSTSSSPSTYFFKWLAEALHISAPDAIIGFNNFVFDIKKQITGGDTINWDGMGTLSKGLASEIKFDPSANKIVEEPVTAERVIREKAGHLVRVGEDEKTSAEMTEMLSHPGAKKSYWWIPALVAGLLAIIFIAWYFYEQGINVPATSNGKKLVPVETAAPYQTLQ